MPGPTRAIARTQQSERVRANVNRHRITQARTAQVWHEECCFSLAPTYMMQSTWLDDTINAVVSGLNTAVYVRDLSWRPVAGHRRKSVKRRARRVSSAKGQSGKAGTPGVRRRRRKVRRKSRRKLAVKKQATPRSRIAKSLGIVGRKSGPALPSVLRPSEHTLGNMRADIGASAFSVYGDPYDLDPFVDGVEQEQQRTQVTSLLEAKRRGISHSALRSHQPVARPITTGLSRRSKAVSHLPACVAEATPVPDLLGSILSGQSMLMMDSSAVVINRDERPYSLASPGTSSSSRPPSSSPFASPSFPSPSSHSSPCSPSPSQSQPPHSHSAPHSQQPTLGHPRLALPPPHPHRPGPCASSSHQRGPPGGGHPASHARRKSESEARKAPTKARLSGAAAAAARSRDGVQQQSSDVEGEEARRWRQQQQGQQECRNKPKPLSSHTPPKREVLKAAEEEVEDIYDPFNPTQSDSDSSDGEARDKAPERDPSPPRSVVSVKSEPLERSVTEIEARRVETVRRDVGLRELSTIKREAEELGAGSEPRARSGSHEKLKNRGTQVLPAIIKVKLEPGLAESGETCPGRPFSTSGWTVATTSLFDKEPTEAQEQTSQPPANGIASAPLKADPVSSRPSSGKDHQNNLKIKSEPVHTPCSRATEKEACYHEKTPKGPGTPSSRARRSLSNSSEEEEEATPIALQDKRQSRSRSRSRDKKEPRRDQRSPPKSSSSRSRDGEKPGSNKDNRRRPRSLSRERRGEAEGSSESVHKSSGSAALSSKEPRKLNEAKKEKPVTSLSSSQVGKDGTRETKKHSVKKESQTFAFEFKRESRDPGFEGEVVTAKADKHPQPLKAIRSKRPPESPLSAPPINREVVVAEMCSQTDVKGMLRVEDIKQEPLMLIKEEPCDFWIWETSESGNIKPEAARPTLPQPPPPRGNTSQAPSSAMSLCQASSVTAVTSPPQSMPVPLRAWMEPCPAIVKQEVEPTPFAIKQEAEPTSTVIKQEAEPASTVILKQEAEPALVILNQEVEPATARLKREAEPAPVIFKQEAEPAPVIFKQEAELAPIIFKQEAEPAPAIVKQEPGPAVLRQEAEPAPVCLMQEAEPARVIFKQEAEPAPVIFKQEAEPARVIFKQEAEPGPAVLKQEAELAPLIVKQEVEPAPAIIKQEAEPAPAIVKQEAEPAPAIVKQEAEPAPAIVKQEAEPAPAIIKPEGKRVTWNIQEPDGPQPEKSGSKLALYKLKLKQDGAPRRTASSAQSSKRGGGSAGVPSASGDPAPEDQGEEGDPPRLNQYSKKLHMQKHAIEEVKLAIKPYYQRKDIDKDEYKEIVRKAVQKVCHSKSGAIDPVKVANLVKAYVDKYKHMRKRQKPDGLDNADEASDSHSPRGQP
ncbi:hypothetical protein NHX12_003597 [Muraenolepis orangiensis]|uniref:SFR19-like C-terminal domain-containing protein n=1 Tax=Muraenolepis orangiensis TaxID=630683 RepID=A0A9Q0E351_9TELE|nr:hypothetical protein NHX12_003597 [Muraenolepis orangiensis]